MAPFGGDGFLFIVQAEREELRGKLNIIEAAHVRCYWPACLRCFSDLFHNFK